jgi:hypothetical protein
LSRGYSESSFRDDLKVLYNRLGIENKKVVFLFGDQHVAEEGFPGQPEKNGGVLADGPKHAKPLEVPEGFAENINALLFQLVQIVH